MKIYKFKLVPKTGAIVVKAYVNGYKLNLLLDDIRVNPKRYISISVFGKKQNNSPLLVPQPDTLNSPYYIKKAK